MSTLYVGIVAIRRPEVLALTLASFRHFCFNGYDEIRIVANVDPLGEADRTAVTDLINSYDTSGNALINVPDVGGFSRAVRWVWSNIPDEANWFLHLEDDWYLGVPVDSERVAALFRDSTVGSVRLFPYVAPLLANFVAFNPMFIRRDIAAHLATLMNDRDDPEYQASRLWMYLTPPRRIASACAPFTRRQVIDTGTLWRKAHYIKKKVDFADAAGPTQVDWLAVRWSVGNWVRLYGLRYRFIMIKCWIHLGVHALLVSKRPIRRLFSTVRGTIRPPMRS